MDYLIIPLLISHVIVLIYINKYIKSYQLNNHNYIDGELKKISKLFFENSEVINNNLKKFAKKSATSLENLSDKNEKFIEKQKADFKDITAFIKSDYKSLTNMLEHNNDLLKILLEKTDENITKNKELKPLLVNSNEELEKVYGKIKMLITNYEKSLSDIKGEMEQSLYSVEAIIESKIKQLAANGEKTILDSIEHSKTTITKVTDETNNGLKKVLHDNQIKILTERVEVLDDGFKKGLAEMLENISQLDDIFANKFKEVLGSSKKDKGKTAFNDLKKWLNS